MSRHYLMCAPVHFDVTEKSNPWMQPDHVVDRERAVSQWRTLVDVYERLGHRVSFLDPVPGLPDMVFTANGAVVVGGLAFVARFHSATRKPESAAHKRWLESTGTYTVTMSEGVGEGEGDFLFTGRHVLAGTGFRTEHATHLEAQEFLGHPVISLRLVDACFYHLDTALLPLDADTVAYYPGAFSAGSRRLLERLYPDALLATAEDAGHFGLNAISDGHHVVIPSDCTHFADRLLDRGYEPIPVDLSEFRASGGGPKCCTLELRPADGTPAGLAL